MPQGAARAKPRAHDLGQVVQVQRRSRDFFV
jgi:hypothetical protein